MTDVHPVEHDPDLRAKLRAAGEADRVAREIADIERRVAGKTRTLGQDFDRVLDVLRTYGYVDVGAWELTEGGEMLARTFHECDLLVTEIVRAGLLDDLAPADLAALVSVVVYEHRSPEPAGAPWFSSPEIRDRWRRIAAISEELQAQERAVGLSEHRAPDPTFAAVAHAWVAGEGFAEVVGDEELTGGDFVRAVKQLIDLLRQLALIAPSPGTRRAAAAAAEAAFRGVVADSSAPAEVGASVTIGRGGEWGRAVAPPAHVHVATTDADVVRLLQDESASVMVAGGDLARTLGARTARTPRHRARTPDRPAGGDHRPRRGGRLCARDGQVGVVAGRVVARTRDRRDERPVRR